MFMRKLFTGLALALPVAAGAATFDFTSLGANNTLLGNTVVVNGVTASGFANNFQTPTPLWLRNQTNDHGLGVCSEGQQACATGGGDVNELDNANALEAILLERPVDTIWTSLWVSSLDSGGTGGSEEGTLAWGNSLAELLNPLNWLNFGYGAFGTAVEGDLLTLASAFDPTARYVLFFHGGVAGSDNDYLVWRGAYTNSLRVPEPGTLVLLGVGLAMFGLRRRRD
jgi:hypothetical protein